MRRMLVNVLVFLAVTAALGIASLAACRIGSTVDRDRSVRIQAPIVVGGE